MKKLAAVIAIVIVIMAVFAGCLSVSSSTIGFSPDDLAAPKITYAEVANVTMPTPITASLNDVDLALSWSITEDIYAGSGGALWLNVENINRIGQMYIYGLGLVWDDGTSTRRDCSVYVSAGEKKTLGLLIFDAPTDPGPHSYNIVVKVAATEREFSFPGGSSQVWRDYGEKRTQSANSAEVISLLDVTVQDVSVNTRGYYSRINSLVSYEAAEEVAEAARAKWPGDYNILQVVEAFEWIRSSVEYKEDAGFDHWQSAKETMELRTGDCEDHAILMASTIGALGGNARVNIVQGHAFPTVFVGTMEQQMEQVEAAIASYYGLPEGQLTASYLVDDLGYWLVVDTTGFPYAGGIPAQSGRSVDGDWSMNSNYLYAIDATGDASVGLFNF